MSERITAWQCIGCGRVDGPRPCIGVCEDRKVELVAAADLDAAEARLTTANARADALASLARLLASTTPSAGHWQDTYLALQQRARALLDDTA